MEAFESMKANGVIFNKPKGNNLVLLLIRITIHGPVMINHQQK